MRTKYFIMLFCLLGSLPAMALRVKKNKPADSDVTDLTFDMPQRPAAMFAEAPEPPSTLDKARFQAMIGAWFPSSLSLPALVPNADNFSKSNWPGLELGVRFDPYAYLGPTAWNFRVSLGLQHLERSAGISDYNAQLSGTQSMFMVPLSLGVEVTPYALMTRSFVPHLGLALVPTFATTTDNFIGRNENILALGGELSLSFDVRVSDDFPKIATMLRVTTGLLGSNPIDLAGFGFGAGVAF